MLTVEDPEENPPVRSHSLCYRLQAMFGQLEPFPSQDDGEHGEAT